jgi:CheY-like chemotaxis protein
MENSMQRTVLVVDDNPDEIRIMKILEKMAPDLKMESATHGKEALKIPGTSYLIPSHDFRKMFMAPAAGWP